MLKSARLRGKRKPDPVLEPSEAEKMLLATGCLTIPDDANVRLSKTIWTDLVGLVVATLDLEKPEALRPQSVGDRYFDKLQKSRLLDEQDYGPFVEAFPAAGATFQDLQSSARQRLIDSHPTAMVNTAAGDREIELEPDGVEQRLWLLTADTVEFPARLIHDIAAGALCTAQVVVFELAFPETYDGLVQVMGAELDRRGVTWSPPLWLNDSLRVFFQEKLMVGVEVTSEPAASPTPQRRTKGALDLATFKAPGQEVL